MTSQAAKKKTSRTTAKKAPAKKAPAKKAPAKKTMAEKATIRKTPAKRAARKAASRAPKDNGIFDPRAALAEVEAKQYPSFKFYDWEDGKTVHELPNPLTLDPVDIRTALGIDPRTDFNPEDLDGLSAEEYFAMLEALVPDAWEAIQAMPLAARAEVLSQWGDFMVAEVGTSGKEPSKPSTPNRAARRSKRT